MLKMKRVKKNSESGFALMESVVFMMAFVVLAAYTIDFFSIIHTGIVNSTAARTYLFETLQHRTNIRFMRQANEGEVQGASANDFQSKGFRFHATADEDQADTDDRGTHAPGRLLSLAGGKDVKPNMSNTNLDAQSNQTTNINIKAGYGICLNSGCPSAGNP
jgi:hypothetical protein